MAVEQGEVAASRQRYSIADVLQLRQHAASNVPLGETGIAVEADTSIIFKGTPQPGVHSLGKRGQAPRKSGYNETAAQWQRAPAGAQAHHPPSHEEAPGRQPRTAAARSQDWQAPSAGHGQAAAVARGAWGEEEWGDAEEDSEDENPQYKALHVIGEPDFSIQEPDAEEYLRRVRWEALRCPRVVVAPAGERPPPAPEQTPYMPHLPGVAACAPHLLPSPEWETRFLADFSDLRTELVRLLDLLEHAGGATLASLPSSAAAVPPLRDAGAWRRFCVGPDKGGAEQHAGRPQAVHPEEGSRGTEAAGSDGVEGQVTNEQYTSRGSGVEGACCEASNEEAGVDEASRDVGLAAAQEVCSANTSSGGEGQSRALQGEIDKEHLSRMAGADGGPLTATADILGTGRAEDEQEETGRGIQVTGSPATTGRSEQGERVGTADDSKGVSAGASHRLQSQPLLEGEGIQDGTAAHDGDDLSPGSCPVRRPRRREALLEGVLPFLGILLRLDQVALAAHLRHHVRWLRELAHDAALDRPRAAWLFALCAAVGKPLDPDTQAALRDLLRTAALRRAVKVAACDPELAMLNILITIAGRYFGQQEC